MMFPYLPLLRQCILTERLRRSASVAGAWLDVGEDVTDELDRQDDSLFLAVLTGYLRISGESIFMGLNNLRVHSISDIKYDESFGFTDREVDEMLEYYGFGKCHDEIPATPDMNGLLSV